MSGMFDAISPSEPIAAPGALAQRADGAVEVGVVRRGGRTALARLYQRAPMRALLPNHAADDILTVALCNVGGGLVAGDKASVRVAVGEGTQALVTSQAAEKVYRSTGAVTRVTTRLEVGAGGWLEWCPQETILFDRARLQRELVLELAGDARVMLAESVVLGRLASGERTEEGFLFDRIRVERDGKLAWLDSTRLEGRFAALVGSSAGLGGARAFTTCVYAGPDAGERLELARELSDTGATVVNGLLVLRFLAEDPLALRRAFALFWSRFRAAVAGLPAAMPRLWHV